MPQIPKIVRFDAAGKGTNSSMWAETCRSYQQLGSFTVSWGLQPSRPGGSLDPAPQCCHCFLQASQIFSPAANNRSYLGYLSPSTHFWHNYLGTWIQWKVPTHLLPFHQPRVPNGADLVCQDRLIVTPKPFREVAAVDSHGPALKSQALPMHPLIHPHYPVPPGMANTRHFDWWIQVDYTGIS